MKKTALRFDIEGTVRTLICLCLAALLLAACSASTVSADKNLQLIRAAEKGETERIIQLIRDGADINAIDKEGWTPYLAASSNGHFEAMRVLEAAGARTEAPELAPGMGSLRWH